MTRHIVTEASWRKGQLLHIPQLGFSHTATTALRLWASWGWASPVEGWADTGYKANRASLLVIDYYWFSFILLLLIIIIIIITYYYIHILIIIHIHIIDTYIQCIIHRIFTDTRCLSLSHIHSYIDTQGLATHTWIHGYRLSTQGQTHNNRASLTTEGYWHIHIHNNNFTQTQGLMSWA